MQIFKALALFCVHCPRQGVKEYRTTKSLF